MTRSLLLLAPLVIAAASAAILSERQSSCACGYKDSTGAVWRESFVSDFTADMTTALSNFYKFTWSETHAGVPYSMQYTAANVYAYNDGLGMKTSAYTTGSVKTAGIGTIRNDIKYGSFRMKATVPDVPEFLSSDTDYYQTMHHTNQPGLLNGDTDPAASKTVVVSGADFTAFHEHRLDWLPASSKYYYDGVLKSTVSKNSPSVASSILANVWSDGGSGWTKGPPTQDAIATIYYIKGYFNSTAMSASQFNSNCAAASNKSPCSV